MRFIFTELVRKQALLLTDYLAGEFGVVVTEKVLDSITSRISLTGLNPLLGKHYIHYRGFDVRQLTSKHNYIFYTMHQGSIYVLALFDTRMSKASMRRTIVQELNKIQTS